MGVQTRGISSIPSLSLEIFRLSRLKEKNFKNWYYTGFMKKLSCLENVTKVISAHDLRNPLVEIVSLNSIDLCDGKIVEKMTIF